MNNIRRFCRKKYTFMYRDDAKGTVTVRANNFDTAYDRAMITLDRRYLSRDKEPPVAWTMDLIRVEPL